MNELLELSEQWADSVKVLLKPVDYKSIGLSDEEHLKFILGVQLIAGVDVCARNLDSTPQDTVEAYKNLLIDEYDDNPLLGWGISEVAKFMKFGQTVHHEEWFTKIRYQAGEVCFNSFESDLNPEETAKILNIFSDKEFMGILSSNLKENNYGDS